MNTMLKTAHVGSQCVACGCCVAACPKIAIHIERGTIAQVDESLCIGCGKCAKLCPAAVISITQRRNA